MQQRLKEKLKSSYGRWALVTGASSGIGLELSHRLSESGLNLLICSRNEEQLQTIASELQDNYKVEVQIIAADLSLTEDVHKLIRACSALDIGLTILSAGYGTSGSFLDSSIYAEQNMLRLNCESILLLTHHFARVFARQKRGGIILLSSMVAFQGVPYAANYAATKAYVQSLAEALAVELKPHGVDVLAAAPGPVKSGFEGRANMEMGLSLKPEQVSIPILKALGRSGTVLPGPLTKFLVYSLRTLPRSLKVRTMKVVMGGMTQHQR